MKIRGILITLMIAGFMIRAFSDLIGSLIFWISLVTFLLYYPLKQSIQEILFNSKKMITWSIFIPYIITHYFIYSIALERILSWIYNINLITVITSSFSIFLTTSPFPADLQTFLINIFFSPSILITIPPIFIIELSFFSIFTGAIISILVTSSILEILKIWKFSKKFRMIVVVPTIGVISGASCCLSIPSILLSYLPLSQIAILSSYGPVLLLLYILLPIVTLIALSINYKNLCKFNFKSGNTS